MSTITRDVSASARQARAQTVAAGVVYVPSEHSPDDEERYWARSGLDMAVETVEGGWVFRDRETRIFGHGATPLDAARDFRAALREHREVLERQTELSDALRQQLDYLRERV